MKGWADDGSDAEGDSESSLSATLEDGGARRRRGTGAEGAAEVDGTDCDVESRWCGAGGRG